MIPFQYLAFEVVNRFGEVIDVYELTDNIKYGLVSYAPTIAPRNRATLTGNATYASVTDTMQIEVLGSTASICVDNYERLMRVLEQSGQWSDREAVLPVRITAEVQNSTVGRLYAVITGPSAGAAPAQTSPEFRVPVGGGAACWVMDATITVNRRGLWLDDLETLAQLTTTGNPTVQTHTFTGDQGALPAPLSVVYTEASGATNLGTGSTYIITASREYSGVTGGSLRLADWSTRTATNWTTVADAANLPFQGTNILRYTRPTTTDTAFYPTNTVSFVNTQLNVGDTNTEFNVSQWLVIAAVRNNSTTVPFFVRAVANDGTTTRQVRTRPVLIDTALQLPRIAVLGVVTVEAGVSPVRIGLEAAAGLVTGSATFDVSYVCFLNVQDPVASVVEFLDEGTTTGIVSATNRDIGYLQESVAGDQGFNNDLANIQSSAFLGDASLTQINASAATTVLSTDGFFWVIAQGIVKSNLIYRARRRRAYRSPQ